MPYRQAHWVMAGCLLPLVLLAFWPGYFGDLRGASFAFHAHGLTASAWLVLVAVQSWSIHHRRIALHRAAGQALFVILPLFTAGGVLAMHGMAHKFAAGTPPFYAMMGARLALHDLMSTLVLVGMVCAALHHRRRVARHAAYMLATVLLVLPPIVARLPVPLPGWLHPGELIAIVLALGLYRVARTDGRPWAIVTIVMATQIVLAHTIGASAVWARCVTALADRSPWPIALAGGLAALVALGLAWSNPAGRPRQAAIHA